MVSKISASALRSLLSCVKGIPPTEDDRLDMADGVNSDIARSLATDRKRLRDAGIDAG